MPQEGVDEVMFDDGSATEAPFPGYREALNQVRQALASEHSSVRFMVPEAGSLGQMNEYVATLEAEEFDAIAFHLYITDPWNSGLWV